MFDFGNDDKEKLRENMEQIKEMVNEGKSPGEENELGEGFEQGGFEGSGQQTDEGTGDTFDSPGQEEDGGLENVQEFDESGDAGQEFEDTNETATEDFDTGQQEEELEQELDEFEEKFGGQQEQAGQQSFQDAQQQQPERPQQEQPQQEQAPNTPPANQQRSETTKGGVTDTRDLSSEVPSPPETRELNVPDIDRGPLFLRQKKFLRAKQMIEDMLYLGDEMEQTVNDLEAGLQEDKEIERDVVEILREFEDNRTEVEDIISPREE